MSLFFSIAQWSVSTTSWIGFSYIESKNNQPVRPRQLPVVRADASTKLPVCQLSERLPVPSCQCVEVRKRRLDEFRRHFATSAFLRLLCETQKHTTITIIRKPRIERASSSSSPASSRHFKPVRCQNVHYIVSHGSTSPASSRHLNRP